jgi:alkylation response protein AidB-like acyl-CoA dehydrogenase
MTEPPPGAGPTMLRTRQRKGDQWVINGDKWYATGADAAAYDLYGGDLRRRSAGAAERDDVPGGYGKSGRTSCARSPLDAGLRGGHPARSSTASVW